MKYGVCSACAWWNQRNVIFDLNYVLDYEWKSYFTPLCALNYQVAINRSLIYAVYHKSGQRRKMEKRIKLTLLLILSNVE